MRAPCLSVLLLACRHTPDPDVTSAAPLRVPCALPVVAAPGAEIASLGSQSLTVERLQQQAALLAGPRLTLAEARAAVLREWLIEARLVELAAEQGSGGCARLQSLIREGLAQAERDRLWRESASPAASSDQRSTAEVRATGSESLGLSLRRLLVSDSLLASELLSRLGQTPQASLWNHLTREHSIDRATFLRGGELGEVHENGQTHRPQVRVDPNLYRAALGVPDGVVVPEPVREGEAWAIVWRVGSREIPQLDAPDRLLAAWTAQREQFMRSQAALLSALRERWVTEFHPELLSRWAPPPLSLSEAPAWSRPVSAPLRFQAPRASAPRASSAVGGASTD